MQIVAIFAVHNEERFMDRSIRHLIEQGVDSYIIDNESTDGTLEIARSFLGKGVIGVETFPRKGMFEWEKLLRRKEDLHQELGADWYLNQDADQFRYAPNPFASLAGGIEAADCAGYNAIDFDVFDFMPTGRDENYDNGRFVEEMKYYYYFYPFPRFQVKAWKNTGQVIDLTTHGGHCVEFERLSIYPQRFIQRHYIALGLAHAIEKYCERVFSPEEVARGWHGRRATVKPQELRFPDQSIMKRVSDDNTWDTSDPWKERFLFAQAPTSSEVD